MVLGTSFYPFLENCEGKQEKLASLGLKALQRKPSFPKTELWFQEVLCTPTFYTYF